VNSNDEYEKRKRTRIVRLGTKTMTDTAMAIKAAKRAMSLFPNSFSSTVDFSLPSARLAKSMAARGTENRNKGMRMSKFIKTNSSNCHLILYPKRGKILNKKKAPIQREIKKTKLKKGYLGTK
jgi:hypothetical protein